MKRNEKIEIRVSLEEKTRLAELAQQEGESVSGLIRGLVGKYVALNSPSRTRRLPKWQLAAWLLIAALIGHGLTLIPIHLHQLEHRTEQVSQTAYYVHGAIDSYAFGTSLHSTDLTQEILLAETETESLTVRLRFDPDGPSAGQVNVSICKLSETKACNTIFDQTVDVQRTSPSVIGGQTKAGTPVHIFIQEMA